MLIVVMWWCECKSMITRGETLETPIKGEGSFHSMEQLINCPADQSNVACFSKS